MRHRLLLGPWTGAAPTFDIAEFGSIGLTYHLDSGDQVTFTMPMNSPATADLSELATDIWLYEDSTFRQRFRVTNIDAEWGESGEAMLAVTALSYKRLLSRRHLWTALSFANVDQAQMVWQIIQHTQAQINGDLGITAGSLVGGSVTRTREYVMGENILKILTDLSGVNLGPLWTINANRVLDVRMPADFPTLATPLVMGVTARALKRQSGAAEFGNAALVDGDSALTAPATAAAAGLAFDPRGRWEVVQGFPTVKQQTTLQERANGQVISSQSPVAEWSAVIEPSRYGGDFYLTPGKFVVVAWPRQAFTVVGLGNNVLCQVVSVTVSVSSNDEVVVSSQLAEIGAAS